MKTFKRLAVALCMILAFTGAVNGKHDPTDDAAESKVLHISSWCKTADDVAGLIRIVFAGDQDAVVRYYTSRGNTCVHIGMVQGMPPRKIRILEIVDHLEGPDGMVGSIAKIESVPGGAVVYTFHFWKPSVV